MTTNRRRKSDSRGINSIEVGYRVLLAVQRGPGAVQLTEVARRSGLQTGAAHNYLASLLRTGLVEQEGRGLYRLGPSAFALSLTSLRQLNGYEIVRAEAQTLFDLTGHTTAVAVWSQAGPVSVFVQRSNDLGSIEFRPGLVPMLQSAVGILFAAYLPDAMTTDLIAHEISELDAPLADPKAFIHAARQKVLAGGYALYTRQEDNYFVLSAPIWTQDDRIAFVLTIVSLDSSLDPTINGASLAKLRESVERAQLFLAGTNASGPKADFRGSPRSLGSVAS
jgi:DNA-binding IclR family transcriptional regulator